MSDVAQLAHSLAEPVQLAIGGRLYSGWTSVSVSRSLEELSGQFDLSLAGKGEAADAAPTTLQPGDACEVRIGGEVVVNGWVDAVNPSIGAEEHGFSVVGRDRTGDLVDCSAIHKPGSWRNVRIEAIAAELTKPFGIAVEAIASTGAPLKRFAIQQGESVHAALERLLRFRGLLMTTTPTGDLQLVTPDAGAPIAVLELGRNILTAGAGFDHRERFSEYVVKGQAAGDDSAHGKAVSQISGRAIDPGVRRYRPMLIVAEEQSDGGSAITRARWEAGVRAGRSVSAELTVPGWRSQPGGPLWRPNTRVTLRSAATSMPDELLMITSATFVKNDDEGTVTRLKLAPPEALQQLAQPEKSR